jgi:hypothetical protein
MGPCIAGKYRPKHPCFVFDVGSIREMRKAVVDIFLNTFYLMISALVEVQLNVGQEILV